MPTRATGLLRRGEALAIAGIAGQPTVIVCDAAREEEALDKGAPATERRDADMLKGKKRKRGEKKDRKCSSSTKQSSNFWFFFRASRSELSFSLCRPNLSLLSSHSLSLSLLSRPMAHAQARAASAGLVGAAPMTRTTTQQRAAAVAPLATRSRGKLASTRRSPLSSLSSHSIAASSSAAASADSSSSSSASASASASSSPSSSRRSRAGRATYAPATFDELVDDASTALLAALDDGLTRIEVEFPALPGDKDGEN
jgi:hypothetical protein